MPKNGPEANGGSNSELFNICSQYANKSSGRICLLINKIKWTFNKLLKERKQEPNLRLFWNIKRVQQNVSSNTQYFLFKPSSELICLWNAGIKPLFWSIKMAISDFVYLSKAKPIVVYKVSWPIGPKFYMGRETKIHSDHARCLKWSKTAAMFIYGTVFFFYIESVY